MTFNWYDYVLAFLLVVAVGFASGMVIGAASEDWTDGRDE